MSDQTVRDELYFTKQLYLHRLHREGYPPTAEKLAEFNVDFYNSHGLEGKRRHDVGKAIHNLTTQNIKKFILPKFMSGHIESKKIFYDVAADCSNKYTETIQPTTRKGTRRRPKNISNSDDVTSNAGAHLTDPDVDLEDFQEEEDEDESELEWLKEQLLEKDREIMQLKNRNEELAKTLKIKDEEFHELEEQFGKTGMIKKKDMAQLMEEKRSLEERVPALEETKKQLEMEKAGNVKESDVAKLEEKIRSLEEIVHQKDQMVEMLIKAQDALLHRQCKLH